MSKANVYSPTGVKKPNKLTLPKAFDEKPNMDLLAQAMRVYEAGTHTGSSKTKTRSEISATKAKVWKQKGTGRARHGARSAPIFVGGGKAHGPTGITRELSLPKKMKRKALNVALSIKAGEEKVIIVEALNKIKKTKEAQKLLNKLTDKKIKKATIVLSDENKDLVRVFRNIANTNVSLFRNLNAHKTHYGGILIFDGTIFAKKTEPKTKKEVKTKKK